jgi:hypothetical protein
LQGALDQQIRKKPIPPGARAIPTLWISRLGSPRIDNECVDS